MFLRDLREYVSVLLCCLAIICLVATGLLIRSFGSLAYFLVFHQPLQFRLVGASPVSYDASVLPVFHVRSTISATELTVGQVQIVTVAVTPERTIDGFLEVWITSPNHREVYKSPLDEAKPAHFVSGRQQTYTFSYVLPPTAVKGAYTVSSRITSANMQADYYVNQEFAQFNVL